MLEPCPTAIPRVPQRYRRLAASRRYLPLNVLLVKRVAAYAGDEICALESQVFINGRWAAERREADATGRPMPSWTGRSDEHTSELQALMRRSHAVFCLTKNHNERHH